jgi:periplasmic protein TonB
MPVSTSTALVFRTGSQDRALFACVLASILLHAAVLFLSPGLRPGPPAAGPRILTATFAPRIAPTEFPDAQQPVVKPPEPQPEPAKPVVIPETPRPVLAKPTPSPVAVPQPPAPAPAPAQSVPAPAAAPTPAVQPPAQQAAGEPPASNAGDAGLVEQYRLALIDAAKRYKRYPAQAMERGWQGKVEIHLVIGADGLIKSATIRTSSSYQILDDQALDMVRKGKPLAQIPAALRGREFSVDVPVIFQLQAG